MYKKDEKLWINNGIDNKYINEKDIVTYLSSNKWRKGFLEKLDKDRIRTYDKVIYCGCDGSGKSTVISRFINNTDKKYDIVHCTRHTPNTYIYFIDLLTSEKNIIFDRGPFGQFIYQTVSDRKKLGWMDEEDLLNIERVILEYNIKVIYVYSDIDNCLYNCKKDSEDSYYTREYLQNLDSKYRYLFNSILSIPVEMYNNNYKIDSNDKKEKIDYSKFDYSSLPKIIACDFDGTLVEDSFPNIGRVNTELVNELINGKYKNWKKILFTNRSGDNLVKACNFCAQLGLYFDAVNDDIPEVREKLNRNAIDHRKIWFTVMIDDKAIGVNKF